MLQQLIYPYVRVFYCIDDNTAVASVFLTMFKRRCIAKTKLVLEVSSSLGHCQGKNIDILQSISVVWAHHQTGQSH